MPSPAVIGVASVPLVDRIVRSLQPRHWYRADTYTLSGGNLATLPNRGSAGGQLAVAAGTIAAPAADATLGGAHTVTFSGSQTLAASHAASEFKAGHDGTAFESFDIFVPTAATFTVWTTRTGATPGITHYRSAGNTGSLIRHDSGNLVSSTAGAFTVSTAGYVSISHATSAPFQHTRSVKEVAVANGAYSGSPSSADPGSTLLLGSFGGSDFAQMRWAETLFFYRVLTPYERQLVREYIAARYGIAAPVWSAEDRAILQLNPFSWIRADYYSTSGGKVTAFLDKVLPGHSMAQGTAANQVVDPVVDANFNGKHSATFVRASATRYTSTLSSSAWIFCHSGSGTTLVNTVRPVDSSSSKWLTTKGVGAAEPGFSVTSGLSAGKTLVNLGVNNDTTIVVNSSGLGNTTLNLATLVLDTYQEGVAPFEFTHSVTGSPLREGNTTLTPSSANPFGNLTLGNIPAGGTTQAANGQWAESILFNRVLTASEQAIVRVYEARYGL